MSTFFGRRARGLLYGGGKERAATVCGDAASVLDHAYHAVEVYVAARKHEQHVAGTHVRVLDAEAPHGCVAVRLFQSLELERVGVYYDGLRIVRVGRSLLRHLNDHLARLVSARLKNYPEEKVRPRPPDRPSLTHAPRPCRASQASSNLDRLRARATRESSPTPRRRPT